MPKDFNIIVIGHKGHGKDEVALILSKLMQTTYISSSMVFIEEFAYDALSFMDYSSPMALYRDRDRIRPVLYQLIRAFCIDDKARLSKLIFSRCPIYAGQRDLEENEATLESVPNTYVVWVDASNRKPLEGTDSFNIPVSKAHYLVDNNIEIENLEEREAYLTKQCEYILKELRNK